MKIEKETKPCILRFTGDEDTDGILIKNNLYQIKRVRQEFVKEHGSLAIIGEGELFFCEKEFLFRNFKDTEGYFRK